MEEAFDGEDEEEAFDGEDEEGVIWGEEEEEVEEIFKAAREGDEWEMRSLLDEDPTLLEREDDRTNRPLAVAAEHGQLGVVRLLIDKDADISATGCWGRMALHYAAKEGHEEVVACLIDHGAQANSRDEDGVTPLMLAALEGHMRVVNMLVQHNEGQGFDERDDRGNTLLHQAAFGGQEQVLRFLLLAGADPTMSNNAGMTPRAVAEQPAEFYYHQSGRVRCVRMFEWWDGELERRALLCRATCLHKAYTTQRDQPTSQVPTYLEARVAAGQAVPSVEVVSAEFEEQQQRQQEQEQEVARVLAKVERRSERIMARKPSGRRKRTAADRRNEARAAQARKEEETRLAMVEYVVKGLNQELLTELMEGFY